MLHFAYGLNMYRPLMRKYAPAAKPMGVAQLADYRFVITADGYASVEAVRAQSVRGVLWRLTPRDRVMLDAWENVSRGLYRAETLTVHADGRLHPALVYIARKRPHGEPKSGYMELVIKAARAWQMPADYIASLEEWLPASPRGAGLRVLGEFG
jgi:cation transport regulator ChaC